MSPSSSLDEIKDIKYPDILQIQTKYASIVKIITTLNLYPQLSLNTISPEGKVSQGKSGKREKGRKGWADWGGHQEKLISLWHAYHCYQELAWPEQSEAFSPFPILTAKCCRKFIA